MEKLILIKTLAQLEELKAYLADKQYVAYDTETTGLAPGSEVIGICISAEIDVGYYVMCSYWDVEQKKLIYLFTKQQILPLLELVKAKQLIMHNAVFDCMITNAYFGVELMPSVHTDTMILAHLLDENRSVGLKELGVAIYGEDAKKEQLEMRESVYKNGGVLTKDLYELYKADGDLIGRYGAKDAILTLKLFFHLVPDLYEQKLDAFFYEDESMPLLRGPTYDMNTTGLRVDVEKLQKLRGTLEVECAEAEAFINKEIQSYVKEKYPGTSPAKTFNIGASKQMAWLLFIRLNNEFNTLTKVGKEVCKYLDLKLPYSPGAKREFIAVCARRKGEVFAPAKINPKTGKMGRPKKIADPWHYLACGKESMKRLATKYKWVERLLEYAKNDKLLTTYVIGIQDRMKYGIIRPSFLQHGTTSGRYSCRNPNFQNLPRDDKRIKGCIIARPGKVFVGADYSQLEPRVFAYFSQDDRLISCFKNGDDFYSVIGQEVFDKYDCSLNKKDKDSFANKYPDLRQISKIVGLSATYGTTAPKMAPLIGKDINGAQEVIDRYFERFPDVQRFMLDSHSTAKKTGRVENLFGRPRRMPKALSIPRIFGNTPHAELPYEFRNILNLAVNHIVQSTGSSIMNRGSIAADKMIKELAKIDARWNEVKIVIQVHDELDLEGPKELADDMVTLLKNAMETAVILPGVDLIAEPKVSTDLAGLK